MAAKPVCLVLGGGSGIGYSVARKWADMGHQVVVTRRSQVNKEDLEKEVGAGVVAKQCDVANKAQMEKMVDEVEAQFGPVATLIYNAGSGVFKTYDALTVEEFEKCMSINTTGLLIAAQIVCPRMVKRGGGVVGVTGATASLRGKPFTAAFAAAKCAQRSLAQSLARDLGPKNVHVFYTIIDGGVRAGATEGGKHMDPEHIAQTYWDVANQKNSSWTFEVDMRPFCENW
eukprot:GFUD01009698.1.p1 GENE.GFUD01009698.1~~GFUD01009698.1.p1  ORF type:complete len:229 (-),score=63.90 GFUD01009698.1:142-828(-)